jgi:ISXO2-like transposase domain
MMIVSLVERDGNKRSFHVTNVNAATLVPILKAQVSAKARLMTDEYRAYKTVGKEYFASHESVSHSNMEYARGDVTTNTAESSFAILKRGLIGTFHSAGTLASLRATTIPIAPTWRSRASLASA